MTTHTPAFDVSLDQPSLPNQHFSSWLRGQTTLFISQIVAVLGIVLFLAEEVYYVSHFGEHSELLEPLTIKLIVDCAHVAFIAVFILVLIQVLDDNERGSYRVKLVHERVFKEYNVNYDNKLRESKEQLKRFKRRFLWFWVGMLFLYVFFACQHSYELAIQHPEPAEPSTHELDRTFSNENKSHDGKEGNFKAEVKYNTTGKEESFKAELSFDRPHGAEAANSKGKVKHSPSELLKMPDVWEKLAFPFIVFFFNNLTQLFVFWCFLVLWIPYDEMGDRYYKYRNRSFLVVGVLTLLFPLLAWIKGEGHTPGEWDAFIAVFDALSGVINAVALTLLIARLDSKLIGLPSWLISILYSYAAVQPLFMVFALNQSKVLEKIATSVLIFVFVSKIYFFLIIIYALQTGKMLNYLLCFPILRRLAKADEPKDVPPLGEGHASQTYAAPEDTKSTESRVTLLLTSFDRWSQKRLGKTGTARIRKVREGLSRWLRSDRPLKRSKQIGLAATCGFFIFLIGSLLTQKNTLLFRADDFTDPAGFAAKLRDAQNPLSAYLGEKFSPEMRLQLDAYDLYKPSPESLSKAVVDELNKELGDSGLFDEHRFEQVSLTEETRSLIEQKPQGDALLRLNRALLEEAYQLKKAESSQIINIIIDCVQLLFVLGMIVILYLLRKENRYGGYRALAVGKLIFKEDMGPKLLPSAGKKQLKKFKEYFLYFWCVTFLLYVVFLLDHLEINLCSDRKSFIALSSKILWSNTDCGLPAQHTVSHMVKILFYPFLEFSLGTLNLLFIFWCFVVLRSPAFDRRAVMRQKMLVNHSGFAVALLIAVFPLLLFWVGGPKLFESNMRDYATVFNGVTGMLSAIVLALLIARMDSTWFGLPSLIIGTLFAYASIQPLFVAFALNDTVLKMVQMLVLLTALGLKICFFLIIAHSLQSGRALNYLICFPFLKDRVDSIFENQFEIRLARGEAHSFTVSILKKNRLHYSIEKRFKSRRRCDIFVSNLRKRMKDRDSYLPPRQGKHPNSKFYKELGTYWVELRSAKGKLLCESIPLRTEEEAQDLIAESIDKIPYCKYNRT
ncbi:MAG: hypothetical protein WCD76_01060 [Pyrinomonadaceae bacterium]